MELTTTLTPDECAARLRSAVGDGGLLDYWVGGNPVVCSVTGRTVRLRLRGYPRQSFIVIFGTLDSRGDGTVFRGYIETPPAACVSVTAGVLGIMSCVTAWLAHLTRMDAPRPVIALVLPLFIVAPLTLLWIVGWRNRADRRTLTAFVARELRATSGSP